MVFPLTTAAIELEAVVMSDCTASEPEVRPAPVRVRVVADQISAAMAVPEVRVRVAEAQMSAMSEPNVVRLRVSFDQTAVAISVAAGADDVAITNPIS